VACLAGIGTSQGDGGCPAIGTHQDFRKAAVYLGSFEQEKIHGIALSAPPEMTYPDVGPAPTASEPPQAGAGMEMESLNAT
jgi:hypothetical protein